MSGAERTCKGPWRPGLLAVAASSSGTFENAARLLQSLVGASPDEAARREAAAHHRRTTSAGPCRIPGFRPPPPPAGRPARRPPSSRSDGRRAVAGEHVAALALSRRRWTGPPGRHVTSTPPGDGRPLMGTWGCPWSFMRGVRRHLPLAPGPSSPHRGGARAPLGSPHLEGRRQGDPLRAVSARHHALVTGAARGDRRGHCRLARGDGFFDIVVIDRREPDPGRGPLS